METPPHLSLGSMEKADTDVRRSFSDCTGVDVLDSAWSQAQLKLRRGGFGLHMLTLHSSAAYIASLCGSDDVISTPQLKSRHVPECFSKGSRAQKTYRK